MVTSSKATPTNFDLTLSRIPSLTSLRDQDSVTLHIYETVIPTITIPSIDNFWLGIKARSDPSHQIEYDDWTFSFGVDANFENWIALYNWMKYITSSSADPDLDHIIPEDNTVKGSLIISDNYRNKLLTVNFHDVWVSSLGEVRLTYRDGDMILEGSGTLKYSHYDITIPE
ncbi:MAG: hypothetical protein WC503_02805 [Candidatus Shapirobacteria bacterium]